MKLLRVVLVLIILASCGAGNAVERITNGGFESGTAGWTAGAYGSSTVVPSGTYGVTAHEGGYFLDASLSDYARWPKTALWQSTTVPLVNTWYEITGWIYPHFSGELGAKQAAITVDWGDGTVERVAASLDSLWNNVGAAHYVQFNSPSPITVYLEIYGGPLVSGDFALFDDISLQEYSSSVPEPGSLCAFASFLLAVAAVRRGIGRKK
ncbi:MAG: hypothetical protein Q7T82_09320 [Armatimonadota bacterium]|nr:hypothetical protein [Armatimonadota bacterium]